jgi:hypothetical protein
MPVFHVKHRSVSDLSGDAAEMGQDGSQGSGGHALEPGGGAEGGGTVAGQPVP